jgi:hypothetical protein
MPINICITPESVAQIVLLGSEAVDCLARRVWWEKILTILNDFRTYALFGRIMGITDHQAIAWKPFVL